VLSAGQNLTSVDAGLVGAPGPFGFALRIGAASDDEGRAVAADEAGDIYVTGSFAGTADFDPGPGGYDLTAVGSADVFVAKYTHGGVLVWAQSFGGTSSEYGRHIAVAADGSVYIAGTFSGTVDFDPGPGEFLLTSSSTATFVLKLDSAGRFVWVKSLVPGITKLVVSRSDGGLLLTGSFSSTADFDPGPAEVLLTSAGNSDAYVARWDAAGDFVWARRWGGISSDIPYGLAEGGDGSLFVTGVFAGSADFDPGACACTLVSAGGDDAFVVRLDAEGNLIWAKQFGGTGTDTGRGIAVADDGSVYAAGMFTGTADFDPGTGTASLTSAGGYDMFVFQLDGAGDYVWAKQLGGTTHDMTYALESAPDGGVYVGGYFRETGDFDPGPATLDLTSAGGQDAIVVRLDAAGRFVWAAPLGGAENDYVNALAAAPDGSVYATGAFRNTADFDPREGVFALTSRGGADAFLVRLELAQRPTDLTLPVAAVLEQQPAGTVVGRLLAADPDPGERFTFRLVAGTGDADNAAFRIEGDLLLTAAVFDFDVRSVYSIRVRVTDRTGLWFEQPLTVTVVELADASAIGDRVWWDEDGDGIQDPGEAGVAGAVAEVFSAADHVSRLSDICLRCRMRGRILRWIATWMPRGCPWRSRSPRARATRRWTPAWSARRRVLVTPWRRGRVRPIAGGAWPSTRPETLM